MTKVLNLVNLLIQIPACAGMTILDKCLSGIWIFNFVISDSPMLGCKSRFIGGFSTWLASFSGM